MTQGTQTDHSTLGSASQSDVEPNVGLLVRIAREFGVELERVRARELLAGAPSAPLPAQGLVWPDWLRLAVEGMGLRLRAVQMTLRDAIQLSSDGALLLAQASGESSPPIILLRSSRRHIALANGEADAKERIRLVDLCARLGVPNQNSSLTWMVVEMQKLVHDRQHDHPHATPWRRLLRIMRPEWSDIWVVLVFAFFSGVLSLSTPIAVEALVNTVAFGRMLQPIFILSLMLFAFLSFSAAMFGLQTYVVELIQRRLFARIVADLAFRLPRVAQPELDNVYGPELVNRFFDIPTLQKVIAGLLLDGVSLALSAMIGMMVLAFYHPWLLGLDILLLVLVVVGIVLLGRGAVKEGIAESKYKYLAAAWLEDVIRCHRTFKIAGGADFASDRANYLTSNYLTKRHDQFGILLRQVMFVLSLQAIGGTVLLGFGGWLVIRNQMTLGQLVAAELIVAIILGSLAKFGKHIEGFYDALVSADKIGYLLDLQVERQDGQGQFRPEGPLSVQLTDVILAIGGRPLFRRNLSLSLQPGKSTALVGSAGTGKSLLLEALFGLRPLSSGHLTLGNVDPRDLRLASLRAHVCLVRRGEIFSGTLEENVHLHRPQIDLHSMRQVLIGLGLLDDIMQLPLGLDTPLLPNGSPLSDSQLSLVLLARGLAGRPKLLLIDGLLDTLDDRTIDRVFAMLLSHSADCTLLVVTNRRIIQERCQHTLDLDRLLQVASNTSHRSEMEARA